MRNERQAASYARRPVHSRCGVSGSGQERGYESEISISSRAEIDLVELSFEIGMADVRRGLIIVNTGPGKGKTTAAMGTALRAVGQGLRVLMLQFLKGSWHYGELDAVQAFGDKFVMKQMGRGFVKVGAEKPDPEDVRMVEEAWNEADRAIQSGEWDLVVLDEINYAISYGMLDPATVVESLRKKPEMVHVILTGRNAHPAIVDIADTVTEMRQVKHAYEKGVMAQRGIEY